MKLKEYPMSETPYEKFLSYGVESLSDAELLAVIIKTGTKNLTSVQLAQSILSGRNGNLLNLYDLSYEELQEFPGIGKVKAIQLKVMAELSKRVSKSYYDKSVVFKSTKDIADYYMEQIRHFRNELVMVALLDASNHLISDEIINTGANNYAFFPIQEILRKAILSRCCGFIVIHNHPSGDVYPSGDDIRVTEALKSATKQLDLLMLDHIIIGDHEYYSFFEHQLI